MDSRYSTSVSVLHSLLVAHLEELHLRDVSESLKEQIPVILKLEKETRTGENELIEVAVIDFFEDCRNLEPESSELIETFHAFMETMIRAHRVSDDLQEKFRAKIEKLRVKHLEKCISIQNLFSFVQGVSYAGLEEEE